MLIIAHMIPILQLHVHEYGYSRRLALSFPDETSNRHIIREVKKRFGLSALKHDKRWETEPAACYKIRGFKFLVTWEKL